MDKQQETTDIGSYMPPEIIPISEGWQLIVAGSDNWDHNERTVNGKRTTHAMITVFLKGQVESLD